MEDYTMIFTDTDVRFRIKFTKSIRQNIFHPLDIIPHTQINRITFMDGNTHTFTHLRLETLFSLHCARTLHHYSQNKRKRISKTYLISLRHTEIIYIKLRYTRNNKFYYFPFSDPSRTTNKLTLSYPARRPNTLNPLLGMIFHMYMYMCCILRNYVMQLENTKIYIVFLGKMQISETKFPKFIQTM